MTDDAARQHCAEVLETLQLLFRIAVILGIGIGKMCKRARNINVACLPDRLQNLGKRLLGAYAYAPHTGIELDMHLRP